MVFKWYEGKPWTVKHLMCDSQPDDEELDWNEMKRTEYSRLMYEKRREELLMMIADERRMRYLKG